MRAPPVAVVVLHYGPLFVTLRCLRALDAVRYPRLRVIVVDNSGSGDALRPAFRGLRRPVRLVPMRGNAGFAKGVNAGARTAVASGAKYVWLLNNDATPEPGALREMVRLAESDAVIAATGSRILDNRVPPRIWQAGATADLRTGLTTSRGAGLVNRRQYLHAADVDWVTGCSLMIRAERFRDLGMLDERFVMYYEETDWCLRAKSAGWRIVYSPRSVVTHHVAGRDERSDGGWLYWETRNRLLLLSNHRPDRVVPVLLRMFGWPVMSALLRGMFRGAWWALRGIVAYLLLGGPRPAMTASGRSPAASPSGR